MLFRSRKSTVTKNLIDLDMPLLVATTVLLIVVAYDGSIHVVESLFLVVAYGVYFAYTILHKDESVGPQFKGAGDILLEEEDRNPKNTENLYKKAGIRDFILFVVGIIGLVVGARYLIESVVQLSVIFDIAPGIIGISAVALGTSLPELLVSGRAALKGKSEVALGNIFGSNAFNALVVVGLPGLFGALKVDEQTIKIGIPFLIISTILFTISGISKRIYSWEGFLYVGLYVLFLSKLFNLF